ncbi:hypothetical protein SAMN04515674_112138 [Pseudarcicella hirudinis]|uniref:DUF2306 domain-containing protein n=1 Tax=Pseudarcicella hirudinis TaxID=1079859 RepID=A0A1I5WS95_9BACT|nr:hypothetical protein [Pseudarcicella hirudinis]SFQ22398.1 hypothetical protein SAMN04515674_112138 [Pseudarcicella hirudinis]
METFLKFVLYFHILCGFLALVTGLVPLIAKKGGKTHIVAGKIYYWAMFGVAITAILRFKFEVRLIFLACIAVFSFYNTFTGIRLIGMKKEIVASSIDWFGAWLAFVCSFAMIGFGLWAFSSNIIFYGVLFTLFGGFCFILAYQDLKLFSHKSIPDKMHWFLNHISRMVGSYIATVTAFLVVNNHDFVPGLVAWIAPGVIGGIGIARWRSYYKKKFKIA